MEVMNKESECFTGISKREKIVVKTPLRERCLTGLSKAHLVIK